MSNKMIYIDLDGVLADWTGAQLDFSYGHGKHFNGKHTGILEPMFVKNFLTEEEIRKNHEFISFWSEMKIFPWATALVNLVDDYCNRVNKNCDTLWMSEQYQCRYDWRFLTCAANTGASYTGKYEWITTHFPQFSKKLVIVAGDYTNPKSKAFLCKPGDVLIDDSLCHEEGWEKAGGRFLHWKEISYNSPEIAYARLEMYNYAIFDLPGDYYKIEPEYKDGKSFSPIGARMNVGKSVFQSGAA